MGGRVCVCLKGGGVDGPVGGGSAPLSLSLSLSLSLAGAKPIYPVREV